MEILEIDGWKLNPNEKIKDAILNRINMIEEITGQPYCPCLFRGDNPDKDIICPCLNYRSGNGCHCSLYKEVI